MKLTSKNLRLYVIYAFLVNPLFSCSQILTQNEMIEEAGEEKKNEEAGYCEPELYQEEEENDIFEEPLTFDQESDDATDPCSICLEKLLDNNENSKIIHIQCNHSFHENCLYELIDEDEYDMNTCPLCRAPFLTESVFKNPLKELNIFGVLKYILAKNSKINFLKFTGILSFKLMCALGFTFIPIYAMYHFHSINSLNQYATFGLLDYFISIMSVTGLIKGVHELITLGRDLYDPFHNDIPSHNDILFLFLEELSGINKSLLLESIKRNKASI